MQEQTEKRMESIANGLNMDSGTLQGIGFPQGKAVDNMMEILTGCVTERPEINSMDILCLIAEEYKSKFLI